jgi:N-acetylneuraminic acid mutarotase
MISKRGCFSAVYHENHLFCFGGLNYTDKILRKCEKYSIAENRWEKISCLNKARKNSSACCLTADTIYIFGGASTSSHTDTIEQFSISADVWTLLKVKLPNAISFLTSFKLSATQILLLGGSAREQTRKGNSYKTNQVLMYDIMKADFTRVANLAKDVISLYPPFYDRGNLFLVDEDGNSENPNIITYDVSNIFNHNN